MAGLAYLAPPLSGLISFFLSGSARVRWHGLQSVLLGLVWPAAMYAGAALSARATQAAALTGAVTWLILGVGAAIGRNPTIPLIGPRLREWARQSPRGETT